MDIIIKELENNAEDIRNVQEFLFSQIQEEYGCGYVEEYHRDIKNLMDYYILPNKNGFFMALDENNNIIATIAIRGYDKEFKEFKSLYTKEKTASIWRLFVDKQYRRLGLATSLFHITEEFCRKNEYEEIYLHTHKNLNGALIFWKKMGFEITVDSDDEFQTVHMIKNIQPIPLKAQGSEKVFKSSVLTSL